LLVDDRLKAADSSRERLTCPQSRPENRSLSLIIADYSEVDSSKGSVLFLHGGFRPEFSCAAKRRRLE
jgi:hypothetical protein